MSNRLEAKPRGRGRPKGTADLTKISGVLAEMARLYREMRSKKTDQPEARTGVWILAQMRDTLAVSMFEKRLSELEGTYLGDDAPAPVSHVRQLNS